MHQAPKDGHTRTENRWTQPLRERRAFGRTDVLTEGWYPACRSRELGPAKARSVRIGSQRIALYRGESGQAYALDAFCPHMGADLGNGTVHGETVRCGLHGWRYDATGACAGTGCEAKAPATAKVQAWPVHEAFGTIWVFAGPEASHPFPTCPGLDGREVDALRVGKVRLYAHHHAMMTGGIDLQHFKAVHGLDIRFDYETREPAPGVLDYHLEGDIPDGGWRARVGKRLVGPQFRYALRVAGGSIAAISYGMDQRLGGTGRALPSLNVLWGCMPLEDGVSEVDIYLLAEKGPGVRAQLKWALRIATTLGLLAVLDDDDKRAFPHMRFDPGALTREDRAVIEMMKHLDALPISAWSEVQP
ncbi:MAG: aromatic ring-hydroxylating dioxygenase subunit alpha [Deltaproteobacteria bacterium]|nr:MAG: aromatic ring-hydroxylating dioxygenase subunit alpha [Deltaproteobacteria bacterium]